MKRKTTKLKTHTSFWTPVKTVKYKPRFHTSSPGPVKLNMYPKRSVRENRLISRHPYQDSDRDKVMNYFDCKPLVRKKQDFMANVQQAKQAAQQAVTQAAAWTAQNVIKPTAQEVQKVGGLIAAPITATYEKVRPAIQKVPGVTLLPMTPGKYYRAQPLPITPETKYRVMEVAAKITPGVPRPSVSADPSPMMSMEKKALEAARRLTPEQIKELEKMPPRTPMPELPQMPGMPRPGRPEIPEKPNLPMPPKIPNPLPRPELPGKPNLPIRPPKPITPPGSRPGPGIPEWYWQQRHKVIPLKK